MAKKDKYILGDIVAVPIGNNHYGFGRILIINSPAIFVGFYKIKSPKPEININKIEKENYLIKIVCGDIGIRKKSWILIGNLQLDRKYTLPYFWNNDALTKQLMLRKYNPPAENPLALINFVDKPTTEEEIKEKDAQPDGAFGWKAAEAVLNHYLEKAGII